MHLILLRHGQSTWQAGLTKDRDSDLTPTGLQQARYLTERFRFMFDSETPPRLISSPLRRASQTASGLNDCSRFDARLAEAEFHVASQLQPPASALNPAPLGDAYTAYCVFRRKVLSFLADHIVASCAEPLVVVTHGGVIKTMLRIMFGSDVVDFRIDNCSVNEARWCGERWQVLRINDTSHLPHNLVTQ